MILSFEFFNPALALGDVCSYAIPAEVWMKKWLMGECAGCVVGFCVALVAYVACTECYGILGYEATLHPLQL